MSSKSKGRRDGFTLIELLVVVSIIALLISILLPTLAKSRKQSLTAVCLSRCRQLGVGMTLYMNHSNCYPAHQWRVGDANDTRVRWFNAMADVLAGLQVQSCPSTPDWEVGRNNSYGYNYKYLGSVRDNEREDNPYRPWERFPVTHVRLPSATIAFADCDGTGWKLPWAAEKPVGDNNPERLGNHGYLLDPTYIPLYSESSYSGGELEPYAWHNWRTYLSDRHLGRSAAIFADGHGESVDPRVAYKDNSMWNGLGVDPGQDSSHPLYTMDRHVSYKWSSSSGQEWRYP
ncbi:MAG: prepilin-type N-terminal cleavage/methylation domain-containing protein [Phycisphaerae bacterium]|nr:prepilin-type N-terminal cleavage/methylation domain-containing protein [Phycisphaerae bacterium]